MEDAERYEYKAPASKGEKNSQLTVGYNYDRSFVVRGNQIGVFKHNPDSLEYSTTIENIKGLDGKTFSPAKVSSSFLSWFHWSPKKLFLFLFFLFLFLFLFFFFFFFQTMLHNQDSSMVLMNPNNSHSLYKLDLTYGQVVEEWVCLSFHFLLIFFSFFSHALLLLLLQ